MYPTLHTFVRRRKSDTPPPPPLQRLKSTKALPAADEGGDSEEVAAIKTMALELMVNDEAPTVQPRGPKKKVRVGTWVNLGVHRVSRIALLALCTMLSACVLMFCPWCVRVWLFECF